MIDGTYVIRTYEGRRCDDGWVSCKNEKKAIWSKNIVVARKSNLDFVPLAQYLAMIKHTTRFSVGI